VRVAPERAESARAALLELFPEGFEEVVLGGEVELAAYTDARGEACLRRAFGSVRVEPVSEGWRDEWKRFHRPVRIGPLWVGPPWERPDVDAIAVVVEPGLAFGTGAHPTTRLCLRLLLEQRRGRLLDAGCGSGVLAVAGAKLGFRPVTALDVDEAAVEASRANALGNGVVVELRRADALVEPLPDAEVTIVNITLAAAEAIARRVRSDALVLSGYLDSDRPRVEGWVHRERREDAGWAADAYVRA
jgi:ribosomal protein L11 methyltransferase